MAEHSYGTHENIVFRILSAIGIVCVVMGHLGCKLLGVDSWLPYYSFHMPLFSFISGYFYNEKYDREPFNWLLKNNQNSFSAILFLGIYLPFDTNMAETSIWCYTGTSFFNIQLDNGTMGQDTGCRILYCNMVHACAVY